MTIQKIDGIDMQYVKPLDISKAEMNLTARYKRMITLNYHIGTDLTKRDLESLDDMISFLQNVINVRRDQTIESIDEAEFKKYILTSIEEGNDSSDAAQQIFDKMSSTEINEYVTGYIDC